jgi:hypothetical protein
VEVKGGFVHLCAHVIYITCPFCPKRFAGVQTREDLDQLYRRVTRCVRFYKLDDEYMDENVPSNYDDNAIEQD